MKALSRRTLLKRLAALAAAPGMASWSAASGRPAAADADLLVTSVDLGEGAWQLGKQAVEAGTMSSDLTELVRPLRADVRIASR